MVAVNLKEFPDDLHHKVKIQAAIEKTTIKGLIIKALTEYLERKQKER
jgi:hypothetical protein